jgi:proline racemase
VQEPIKRTYRGATPDAAANAYRADAAKAQAAGYAPISHRWAQDGTGHTLSVTFQLRSARAGAAAVTTTEERSGEGTDAAAPGQAPMGQEPEAGRPPAEVVPARPQGSAEQREGEAAEGEAAEGEWGPTAPPVQRPADAPAREFVAQQRPMQSREDAAASSGRRESLTVQVLDMHAAGEPLRIVRTGYPDVPMMPVLDRRRWVAQHADHVRRAIVNEPRGHRDMYAAVLLPPYSSDVDICLLFMHNEGYSTMCGHGVIAVTTALIEEGLFPATEPVTTIRYEVPAGVVAASASVMRLPDGGYAVGGVRFTNVPSYLAARSLPIRPDGVELHGRAAQAGHLAVDLAFGGAYYGIVDAAQLGLRVVPEQASLLRQAGAAITEMLRRDHTPSHPTEDELSSVYGTIIVDLKPGTSPDGRARDAHIRNATVFADAELDRSPCGSGTSAILAQLHARGRLGVGQELINAGITGEHFVGRVESETRLGGEPAVVTSIAGTAYVTGYGTLVADERDPLGEGFVLS